MSTNPETRKQIAKILGSNADETTLHNLIDAHGYEFLIHALILDATDGNHHKFADALKVAILSLADTYGQEMQIKRNLELVRRGEF